jgi:hypothetical protein
MDAEEIAAENQRRRWAFLKAVYELSGGHLNASIDTEDALERAGIKDDFRQDLGFLLQTHLIDGFGAGEAVGVSLSGIEEVERVLKRRDSEHFQVITVLGDVTNSNIALNSPGAHQQVGDTITIQRARELLPQLIRFVQDRQDIPEEWRGVLEAQAFALKNQLEAPEQNPSAIRVILNTLSDIAISAAGSGAWVLGLQALLKATGHG